MWVISSLCFSLVSILFSLSLHQGLASESGCRLVLSKNNQSLAVQIGSTGELICQISSECNLTGRILGPFWTLADKSWFVSNTRMFNTRINSTTISLRYAGIIHEDLGIYHCVVRIGRKMLSIAANITERLGKEGDVFVTTSPDHETEPPRKKRYAVPFVGVGLVRAVPPRNYQRLARRSLQSKTKDSHHGNPSLTDYPARGKPGLRPLKTPCDEEKLFSKTGIIIVAALVCSTFLLLYMVILLMAVPRICFPYYPKKKHQTKHDDEAADPSQNKGGSTTKVNIPLSQKVRHNGRSDSGIESVDGLEEKGLHHGGGRSGSHWEIGADKLEEFYRRRNNQNAESDEDMLSGLKIYNMEKNIPRRGRSESVPVTPYRYQSSIYVKI